MTEVTAYFKGVHTLTNRGQYRRWSTKDIKLFDEHGNCFFVFMHELLQYIQCKHFPKTHIIKLFFTWSCIIPCKVIGSLDVLGITTLPCSLVVSLHVSLYCLILNVPDTNTLVTHDTFTRSRSAVCVSFYMSVSSITQNVMNGLWWNLMEGSGVVKGTCT